MKGVGWPEKFSKLTLTSEKLFVYGSQWSQFKIKLASLTLKKGFDCKSGKFLENFAKKSLPKIVNTSCKIDIETFLKIWQIVGCDHPMKLLRGKIGCY